MKSIVLTLCLTLPFLSSSAQSTQINKSGNGLINEPQKSGYILINSFQVRSILRDHAELVMLREQYKADSAQISNLTQAYYFKTEALKQAETAISAAMGQAQDWHGLYETRDKQLSEAKKEVRKQKRIKWLCIIGGVLGVVLL